MEGRKWKDLSADCLVNVFGRVGIESLLSDVPFVCKSWLNATLSSLCWQELDFSQIKLRPCHFVDKSRIVDEYQLKCNRSVTEFIKCPDLKVLLLSCITPRDNLLQIPNLVSKWKNLEFLGLLETFLIQEVFTQISIHCKNFIGLTVVIAIIKQDVASALDLTKLIEELLKLASHICTFKHEGSRLYDDYDDYFCYQDTVYDIDYALFE
ncbi:F-box protein FBW2-like [Camellia sinensis]|uniref:F-box protein FBW2-like n=1 Tax=Camellia sinensis TaxID=4442 RepID=UPI001035D1EF|nr:F-box protein FBW2-like [Camellia sinensis]